MESREFNADYAREISVSKIYDTYSREIERIKKGIEKNAKNGLFYYNIRYTYTNSMGIEDNVHDNEIKEIENKINNISLYFRSKSFEVKSIELDRDSFGDFVDGMKIIW